MKATDPLKLNLRKAASHLVAILPEDAVALILAELNSHVSSLLQLAKDHLRFAEKVAGKGCWRQRVSRAYYACYAASRAVRLHRDGTYKTDVSDHYKCADLPPVLSDKWGSFLTGLHGDRKIADYDHRGTQGQLEFTSGEYVEKAKVFLKDVKDYLLSKGVSL